MDLRKESAKLQKRLAKVKTKGERIEIYKELKGIKKDLKRITLTKTDEILKDANLICCTLTSANDRSLKSFIKKHNVWFDVCVIDECA